MFERLGSLSYRFRFAIVAVWVAAAIGAVLYAPSLASQGMTNQTDFLPSNIDSVEARHALDRAFPGELATSSATVSFSRSGGLTATDHAYVTQLESWITSADAPAELRDAVTGVATADSRPEMASMLRSADGALELMTINLNVATAGGAADVVIAALRAHLVATAPADMAAHVTGTAAISTDYLAAIIKGTDSTTLVTVVLVIAILLLIYRAPLAAMVPLVTIGAAFLVSRGVLGILAAAGWKVSSLLDTFIVVLVFGVGTDYTIFLISRFREEVAKSDWHDASRATVRRIGAVISASAATVIVGLGSMAFAEFGMIQTMGPALAVAIFVTLIAGLTLAPALLAIFGHYLFWPLHTRREPEGESGGLFARVASAVSRRPVLVTVALLIALGLPVTAMGQMRTNFDVLAELPAGSDARAGFDDVATHLGKGKIVQSTAVIDAGAGADLLTPASLARLRDLSQSLVATDGVATVTSLVSPDGDGVVPDTLKPSGQLAEMAGKFEAEDTGTETSSEALLDGSVTDGLDAAAEYMGLLGRAFPDAAAAPGFRAVTTDLSTARDQVEGVRKAAVVSTQLRSLSKAMTSPTTAAGGSSDSSAGLMRDYLEELATAFPDVRGVAAFDRATAAAASLEKQVSISAALDLSSAFSSLAGWFEDTHPEATLSPRSLSGTADAKAKRAEIEATFKRLPADLDSLSRVFAARADDVFVPLGISGDDGRKLQDAVAAFVSADRTAARFYLTTDDDPYSPAAFAVVRRVQQVMTTAAPGFGTGAGAYLGGPTAEFSDVQVVLGRDFERVAIVTVLGILVVLVLLLRAVVAPLYLVATVLLSCATALGLSTWLFQSMLGQPGVSFYLPIIVFVLLVALGSDYNIFLMSRVREESEGRPIHDGIRIASGRTGAVITSAGLILAGTFGSMASAPLVVLFQVGVAVALGVLIDTFVVRSVLVPAITTLAGDRAWWPWGSGAGAVRVGWPVVITVPETASVLSGRPSRRRLAVAVAMIALVPVTFAGLLTWSMSNPTANLSRVTAAVVDQDEGATATSSDGRTTRLTLGADLARQLTSGTEGGTFSWHATDAGEAGDGLAAGRYAAVLTIPTDFSTTIAAIQSSAAANAERATLRLETNDATSYLLGTIARSLSGAIAASTSERVTAAYVDDVLLSVNTTRSVVSNAAADADKVASDTTNLADGASTVSSVADELVTGLKQLADGTSSASEGVDRLAGGVADLADGTDRLATGATKLDAGTKAAADGTARLATGVHSLADGLGTLSAQTAGLPAQAAELATGATGVSDGATGVASGAALLAGSLAQLQAGTTGLGDQAATLDAGAAALAAGAHDLATGAGQSASGASDLAAGAHDLSVNVSAYTGAVAGIAASCTAMGGSDPLCAQLQTVAAGGDQLNSGAAGVASGAAAVAAGSGQLASGANDLAGAASALRDGTHQLAASAPQLESGIAQAAGGAASLASGASDLAAGAGALSAGATTFAASAPLLAQAVADAATGAQTVAGGADKVADGVSTLANGVGALAGGARATADGASALADGTRTAATGASKLASGMGDALDGARMVVAEADGLASDGQAIAGSAGRLATGLGDQAASIPEWSHAARESVGGIVANPVTVDSSRLNAMPTTGAGLAPYFMALALWLGGLAIYLVLPALPRRGGDERWWAGALGAFGIGAAIGIAQALLMVLVLRYGVGIEIARLPELVALAILVAIGVVAVTQALVALFGTRGWFAALLLLVVQLASAGAWFPVQTAPALIQAIHPLLPMTYAIDAFRTLVAGGGSPIVPAVVVLALWAAVPLAVTLLAARVRSGRAAAGTALAGA